MKKAGLVLVIALVLLFATQNLFADPGKITSSIFTDMRVCTWLYSDEFTGCIQNQKSVKFALGQSLGYYRDLGKHFNYGFEVRYIGRETATGKYYGQFYTNLVTRLFYGELGRGNFFLDAAGGCVYSYQEECGSFGWDAAVGLGYEYCFSDSLSTSLASRFVWCGERYGHNEKAYTFSWQPAEITFCYKY